MQYDDLPTVYLTREAIQRLAALSCDALVGIQVSSDVSPDGIAYCHWVPIDNPNRADSAEIHSDGSHRITT
jgi:hypothetical protein